MDANANGIALPESRHASRLGDAVEEACRLLYYAASAGRDITPAVRDPILTLRAALVGGEPITAADEGRFLDAYARLAVVAAPVTAVTLRATSALYERGAWWARLLRLGPVSEAQARASSFGVVALGLLLAIGAGEWTRTFIETITSTQKQFAAVAERVRTTGGALNADDAQIVALKEQAQGAPSAGLAILLRQRDELNMRFEHLRHENDQVWGRIRGSYSTLHRILFFVSRDELENIIVPLGFVLGGFLLPVLYGALGTCAFILRTLYGQMIDRSFDPRRSSEFIVRIFLGMLSGITLQWLFVKDGSAVPGGITPAVLAFLGGYSVELLFSGMDRLLALVTGKLSPPHYVPRTVRPPVTGAHAAGVATGPR